MFTGPPRNPEGPGEQPIRRWAARKAARPPTARSFPGSTRYIRVMTTISISLPIAAPAERVMQVFTELEKAPDRIPGIESVELLSEGPFGEGTRWRETRIMFKKQATEEMWVTDFDPPRSYTVEAESHGMRYSTLIELTPTGEGTRATWTFSGTATSFGAKVMSPIFGVLMKGTMKTCMLGDLEALRDHIEGAG